MQLQVTIDGADRAAAAKSLRNLADLLWPVKDAPAQIGHDDDEEREAALNSAQPKTRIEGKAAAKAPAKKAAPVEEDEETDEVEETEEDEDAPSISLNDDVIPAFNKFVKKNSREDAIKILKKFKVKSVRDVNEEDYERLMTLLDA